jgi:hypothetical protein
VIVNFPSLWQVPEKQFIGREDLFWLPLSEISAQGRSDALLRPEEPVAETAHLTAARKEKGSRRRGRERRGKGTWRRDIISFQGAQPATYFFQPGPISCLPPVPIL